MKIRIIAKEGFIPRYHSEAASGADLLACIAEPLILAPGERVLVPTGVSLEIPPGFEGQIRPRSGLAINYGVTTLNSPGTIDADYRGEIKVILINLGQEPFTIRPKDRIAQLVIAPVLKVDFELAEALNQTERATGGFGSTGV